MRDAPQADIHSFGLVIAAPYDGELSAHLIASRNSDSEGKGGGRERGGEGERERKTGAIVLNMGLATK